MKRSHRQWHRRVWLLLAPLLVAVMGLLLLARTELPINAELPTALVPPAAQQGG
jgi:hypothetical protein